MSHLPKDRVTCEYVAATRMGVHIRTPLENVTHFKADQKCVTIFTKSNGEFVVNLPLWQIAKTLSHLATSTHRSFVIMNHQLKGSKFLRVTEGGRYVIEVINTVRFGNRWAMVPCEIHVGRREVPRVREVWRKANA